MPFDNMPYEGGVLVMGGNIKMGDIVENAKQAADMQKKAKEIFTKDWNSLLSFLPVIDLDKKILGEEIPTGGDGLNTTQMIRTGKRLIILKSLKNSIFQFFFSRDGTILVTEEQNSLIPI